MLRVTIANIEASLHGVFETEDKHKAAELAVAGLVKNRKFLEGCYAYPCESATEAAYGMVLMPGDQIDDPDELSYLMDGEDTYWIFIAPFEPNKMIDL